jgi:hypothetical protein
MGEAYLISGADLAAADAADGTADGVIDLDFITDPDFDRSGSSSYQFIGTEAGDYAGSSTVSAGDVDGDGLADLIVGAICRWRGQRFGRGLSDQRRRSGRGRCRRRDRRRGHRPRLHHRPGFRSHPARLPISSSARRQATMPVARPSRPAMSMATGWPI